MKNIFSNSIVYLFLIFFGIMMILPFIWMISTSLMSQAEFNKNESVFIPKEEYYVWNENGKEHRIILVQQKKNIA